MRHHRHQKTTQSCVAASISTAFSLCGQDVDEEELYTYADVNFWHNLPRQPRTQNDLGPWCVVPWLGHGRTLCYSDENERYYFELALEEHAGPLLFEISPRSLGGFILQQGVDAAPRGALPTQLGWTHSLAARLDPTSRNIQVWDPWYGPTGQPLGVEWDELGCLAIASFLLVDPAILRKPDRPEDKVSGALRT